MSKEKKKLNLFEKIEFTDPEYAQKTFDKENTKFKFKLICSVIAAIGSIGAVIVFNGDIESEFLETIISLFVYAGWGAWIISGGIISHFKTIAKICGWIFILLPIPINLGAMLFMLLPTLYVPFLVPVIPTLLATYQSYKNRKDAGEYLAYNNILNQVEQASPVSSVEPIIIEEPTTTEEPTEPITKE